MNLQHLSDIHTGRHTQGVQHNIQGTSVGKEGHILHRKHSGNHTLVSMTACHLIAHGNLSLLGNVNAHGLVHAGSQLVSVFSCKYLGIYHDAVFAVRHLQGSIPHLSGLLAEDRPQQTLLRCQFRLSLGGYFAHQDIAGSHLSADADDSSLIQIFQGIVTYAGHVPGNFLRSQLGISGFSLILLNMNGRIYVVHYQTLA